MNDKTLTTRTDVKKGRPLNIPRETIEFLQLILNPEPLKHDASHADFIKNEVKRELWATIMRCHAKKAY